jgi:hypothetical protein
MIEDMTVRGFKDDTRRDYVRSVRAFAAFIGRSPDTAKAEDLRLFQLHQTQSGMQPPSVNSAVSALRFFFTLTLDRPELALPAEVAPIAYQNKAVVYDLLFRAAETLLTIAPTGQARGLKAHDPKHLGARIGATAVLHSWGSAMTHHPHVHMIVPGRRDLAQACPGGGRGHALGTLQVRLSAAGAGAVAPVPAALPDRAC